MTLAYWSGETNVTAVTTFGTVSLHISAWVTFSPPDTDEAFNNIIFVISELKWGRETGCNGVRLTQQAQWGKSNSTVVLFPSSWSLWKKQRRVMPVIYQPSEVTRLPLWSLMRRTQWEVEKRGNAGYSSFMPFIWSSNGMGMWQGGGSAMW